MNAIKCEDYICLEVDNNFNVIQLFLISYINEHNGNSSFLIDNIVGRFLRTKYYLNYLRWQLTQTKNNKFLLSNNTVTDVLRR